VQGAAAHIVNLLCSRCDHAPPPAVWRQAAACPMSDPDPQVVFPARDKCLPCARHPATHDRVTHGTSRLLPSLRCSFRRLQGLRPRAAVLQPTLRAGCPRRRSACHPAPVSTQRKLDKLRTMSRSAAVVNDAARSFALRPWAIRVPRRRTHRRCRGPGGQARLRRRASRGRAPSSRTSARRRQRDATTADSWPGLPS
jgi:hypothetical protein